MPNEYPTMVELIDEAIVRDYARVTIEETIPCGGDIDWDRFHDFGMRGMSGPEDEEDEDIVPMTPADTDYDLPF